MAIDYKVIYDNMEDGELYSAKRLMVAPASLTAMVRRGMIERIGTKSPYLYRKCTNNKLTMILAVLQQFPSEYFTIFLKDRKLGMCCSCKNGQILDCYGKAYDISQAIRIEIYKDGETTKYNLE